MLYFFFFGLFLQSVANTLVASCSADIGRDSGTAKSVTSTVTGIIDGSGGVGSAVAMFLIGVIREKKGWQIGYLLPISIVCTLSIIPIGIVLKKEIKEIKEIRAKGS
jgi:sugar phosphate permease